MLTRSDLKNSISLVGAEGISRGLAFVMTVFIARELGVFDFGMYSTAVSFVMLFSVFVEIGLNTYVYREGSKDRTAATQYIFSALLIQMALSVVVGIVVSVTAIIVKYPMDTREAIALLWLWIVGISLGGMIRTVFRVHLRMEIDALITIIEDCVRFVLVMLALHWGYGVRGIAIASIISGILMLFISALIAIAGKYLHFSEMHWDTGFLINLIKVAWPFALSMIASVMMYRLSTVILSIIKGDYDVGIFDASFKITMSLFFIPSLVCNAFFPRLTQYASNNIHEYASIILLLTRYIFLLMYPLLMVIYVFAPPIIGLVYTKGFSPTITVLQILVWVNVFNAGTYIGMYALNAAGHEKDVMRVMFIGLGSKVLVSTVLITIAGYTGAAIGALISELLVTSLFFYYLHFRQNPPQLVNIMLKIIWVMFASFGAILFAQLFSLNTVFILAAFIAVFVLSVLGTKLVTVKDWVSLRKLVLPQAISE